MNDTLDSQKENESRRIKRIDEKAAVTSKISDTTRFVAFGLLVIFYGIHIGDDSFATQARNEYPNLHFFMGLLSALAILLDYLQYVFGFVSVEDALKSESQEYDSTHIAYKARDYAFKWKQYCVIGGASILVFLVAYPTFCAPSA
ncbi:MAG: hypothetical protein RIB55_01935 [Nitratireductor sp.]